MYLSSVEGEGSFKGKCSNCGKVCGFKSKGCKKCKENLHSGCTEGDNGAIQKVAAPMRHVISVA